MPYEPFLRGKPVPFSEAFPNIGEFNIDIEQDHWHFHNLPEWRRKLTYSNAHPPPQEINCINPRCQQGGLDLRNYIVTADMRSTEWVFEEIFSCGGHEGSPQGRRKGAPCDNAWKVRMNFAAPKKQD